MAATIAECRSATVATATRAAKVEALNSWSACRVRMTSSTRATSADGACPSSSVRKCAACEPPGPAATGSRPVRRRCQAATVAGTRLMSRQALRRFASGSLERTSGSRGRRERHRGAQRVERVAVARQAAEQIEDRRGQRPRLREPRREGGTLGGATAARRTRADAWCPRSSRSGPGPRPRSRGSRAAPPPRPPGRSPSVPRSRPRARPCMRPPEPSSWLCPPELIILDLH